METKTKSIMFSLLFAFSLISFCTAQPANADTLKNKELELDQTEKRIEKIENNLAKMQIYTHNHAFLTHGQYNFYIILIPLTKKIYCKTRITPPRRLQQIF